MNADSPQDQTASKGLHLPGGDYLPAENLARIDTHAIRPKGGPRHNPSDFTISIRSKFGTDQQLLHPGARRQSLRGFEETYTDIIDFIVRATHKVWEEKDVGYIYELYSHRARVTDDSHTYWGRDQVIANTLQAINAYPDFRGFPTEIVWAGDDEVGFYTSHRAVVKATNTGYSQFGPPTGKTVEYWLIADCITIANEIFEEWVLYNTSAMLQQLGFDLRQKARELGNARNWDSLKDKRFGEPQRLPGQGKPRHIPPKDSSGFDVEDFLHRTFHYIWNWRMLGKVREAYAPGLRFFGPTDRAYYGTGEYQAFVMSLLAMFPDLELTIDDLYWMGNDAEGYATTTRWSIVGTHTGPGVYGPPTGRRIYMWGITQHAIKDGQIAEEWMMFNEFDVMQQIFRD
jgi:predicted ester cyclase